MTIFGLHQVFAILLFAFEMPRGTPTGFPMDFFGVALYALTFPFLLLFPLADKLCATHFNRWVVSGLVLWFGSGILWVAAIASVRRLWFRFRGRRSATRTI